MLAVYVLIKVFLTNVFWVQQAWSMKIGKKLTKIMYF